ncbi:FAD-binding and (Fe-S)-binding domain-containing protein [Thalassotalea mangrovi]|uniref:D-lactate dehydrogenase (cytochrome) n=1 Tax=Thalassotalea mangrovi TaxID=2572245 RepID=A0A4U1B8N7_9GAMM|nr:FAD-binding and (Fe-S)-binding domain-containing protein [Thalassotalea mangrovi]TKB46375.1 FAD-binding oxidoreductase [Thalassotalea mangrovi]
MSVSESHHQHTGLTVFIEQVARFLASEQIIDDYTRRYAYGTDASFYRLVPEYILHLSSLAQVQLVLEHANQCKVPVTFRAAGTSLSGQAISDSVLIILSEQWQDYQIFDNGEKIKLQPGLIGARVNEILKPYGRKIGPDPASIDSCKVGGIAANNSSGMCCGVKQNSYHTVADVSMVLADGTLLDTSDRQSCQQFIDKRPELYHGLMELAVQVQADEELAAHIAHKYRLKNTTGYGINALLDFQDGIEIIKRLLIGSEGTLGFIADITYHTVVDHKLKSAGLFIFNDIRQACELVPKLAPLDVAAVELLDSKALHAVERHPLLAGQLTDLPAAGAALLIEVQADDNATLSHKADVITDLIDSMRSDIFLSLDFSQDVSRNAQLWNIRKGTFPAVGAHRDNGTTVIIEDVAFAVQDLAAAVTELQQLFVKYHYHEAIIFGHALDGNLHFVFTQAFATQEQIGRYQAFMEAVSQLVVARFGGSLKAEHGTGRNMAPFVRREWGDKAYQLMLKIKALFDEHNILNPGVIINDDPHAHLQHLKAMPAADDIIDKCIECGFCEPVCPSNGLTLTPRQRITVWRRISELKALLADANAAPTLRQQWQLQLQQLQKDYPYMGIETCAATGLCGMRCPVDINTGEFVKAYRQQAIKDSAIRRNVSKQLGNRFATTQVLARWSLAALDKTRALVGEKAVSKAMALGNSISKGLIPEYQSSLPASEQPLAAEKLNSNSQKPGAPKVIYFPTCAGRIFAADSDADDQRPLPVVFTRLLQKAGFDVVVPESMNQLCCGMPFSSKGDAAQGHEKAKQVIDTLDDLLLSERKDGETCYLVTDASSCALHLKEQQGLLSSGQPLKVYEAAEFLNQFVVEKLTITPVSEPVMLHITCSSKRLGQEKHLLQLAQRCAAEVIVPADIHCCGFAGDKGFFVPELNANALKSLHAQKPENCQIGVSNARTCEIGLSKHSQIPYQSIVYLLDKVSINDNKASKSNPDDVY